MISRTALKSRLPLIISLIFGLFFFIHPDKAFAADLTITCNSDSCVSSTENLFNHTNISPGFSIVKTIQVENLNTDSSCDLQLYVERAGKKNNPDLAEKLSVVITRGGETLFGNKGANTKSIADMFDQNIINWGSVQANTSAEYIWETNFNTDSGNEYQQSSASFNFSLNFVCNTPIENGSNVDGVETTNRGTGLIAHVLGNISQSEGNGQTDENTDNIASEQENSRSDKSTDSTGSILGTECSESFPWWIIILLQIASEIAAITAVVLRKTIRKLWLIPVISAIIFQIAHYLLGCDCTNDYWCPKYIFINLALTAVTLLVWYYLNKKNQQFP